MELNLSAFCASECSKESMEIIELATNALSGMYTTNDILKHACKILHAESCCIFEIIDNRLVVTGSLGFPAVGHFINNDEGKSLIIHR